MYRTFIISDLHLGHRNMALKRGFKTVEEHDQHIIDCWNSVVQKKDTVWILGDITMEKISPYPLLDKMLGWKKVIMGNHDRPQHAKELLNYVNAVAGMHRYKKAILTHCPIYEQGIPEGFINVHGHVHNKTVKHEKYINVSAEVLNYTPILFTDIDTLKKQG